MTETPAPAYIPQAECQHTNLKWIEAAYPDLDTGALIVKRYWNCLDCGTVGKV